MGDTVNPYNSLPPQHFWSKNANVLYSADVDYDFGKKFVFRKEDIFATAGSCFAQHFAARLSAAGGAVLQAESAHPLIESFDNHGYGAFSARYGNIYTARQLKELTDQALGVRPMIAEFAVRPDGRVIDMLRPRAVPFGFSSVEEAHADRVFHLRAVKKMLKNLNVFVFTLGLTEAWINWSDGYCYPVVPGAVAGVFDEARHAFVNFGVSEVVLDMVSVIDSVLSINPTAKVVLTVSPVSLVATAEHAHVAVATTYSKSVLRVAAQEVVRKYECVDYFPSYEIITGPLSRGRFWAEDRRDVTTEGVDTVMRIFFKSRMSEAMTGNSGHSSVEGKATSSINVKAIQKAVAEECDEMFLDPSLRATRSVGH